MQSTRFVRPCSRCETPVPTDEAKGYVFCSVACYRSHAKRHIRPEDVVFVYERTCEVCGKLFGTNVSWKKTCSKECSNKRKVAYVKSRKKTVTPRNCPCGRLLPYKKQFCCEACRDTYGATPLSVFRQLNNHRSLHADIERMSEQEYDLIYENFEKEMGLQFQVLSMFEDVKALSGCADRETQMLYHLGEFSKAPKESLKIIRKYSP